MSKARYYIYRETNGHTGDVWKLDESTGQAWVRRKCDPNVTWYKGRNWGVELFIPEFEITEEEANRICRSRGNYQEHKDEIS